MLNWLQGRVDRAHEARGWHVFVIVLRMMIGFAFVPAGLKKLLGQPFTDPSNVGPFHEFLHAFHATGLFYQFVGAVQLLAAFLLITQTFATLGAVLLLPVLSTIFVFCWVTQVIPTATVVTLMMMGLGVLLIWDIRKWRLIVQETQADSPWSSSDTHPQVNMKLWRLCGGLILSLYFGNTLITQEVYRPRGADWSNPSFVLLQIIALLPLLTWFIDRRQSKRDHG